MQKIICHEFSRPLFAHVTLTREKEYIRRARATKFVGKAVMFQNPPLAGTHHNVLPAWTVIRCHFDSFLLLYFCIFCMSSIIWPGVWSVRGGSFMIHSSSSCRLETLLITLQRDDSCDGLINNKWREGRVSLSHCPVVVVGLVVLYLIYLPYVYPYTYLHPPSLCLALMI